MKLALLRAVYGVGSVIARLDGHGSFQCLKIKPPPLGSAWSVGLARVPGWVRNLCCWSSACGVLAQLRGRGATLTLRTRHGVGQEMPEFPTALLKETALL